MKTVEERFLEKVYFDPNGCWIWTAWADKNQGGKVYGRFRDGTGERAYAHRWAYERWIGPMPDGLQYRHAKLCPTRCVNPWHCREPGTGSENARDSVMDGTNKEARKTHCPQGHEYTPENTYMDSKGARRCSSCNRDRCRRYKLGRVQALDAVRPD